MTHSDQAGSTMRPNAESAKTAACETALRTLEARVAAFADVLGREEQSLREHDTERLLSTASDKRALLAGLEAGWQALFAAAALPAGETPIALTDALGGQHPALATRTRTLIESLRECQARNLALGAVLAERRQMTEATLSWLTGGTADAPAYGPGGNAAPRQDQRSLGQA